MLCRSFTYHVQFRKHRRTKLSPSFLITPYISINKVVHGSLNLKVVQVEYWKEEVCVTYAYKLLRCIYLEGSLGSLAKSLFEEGSRNPTTSWNRRYIHLKVKEVTSYLKLFNKQFTSINDCSTLLNNDIHHTVIHLKKHILLLFLYAFRFNP